MFLTVRFGLYESHAALLSEAFSDEVCSLTYIKNTVYVMLPHAIDPTGNSKFFTSLLEYDAFVDFLKQTDLTEKLDIGCIFIHHFLVLQTEYLDRLSKTIHIVPALQMEYRHVLLYLIKNMVYAFSCIKQRFVVIRDLLRPNLFVASLFSGRNLSYLCRSFGGS